jgi:pyruvate dehydrogenase E1 component alpha subunit
MDKAEKAAAIAKDPVPLMRSWLVENNYIDVAALDRMEAEIAKEIDAAVEFALSSASPDAIELERDVLAVEH